MLFFNMLMWYKFTNDPIVRGVGSLRADFAWYPLLMADVDIFPALLADFRWLPEESNL